ncbi:M20 family metallopeptidase [Pseudothermotoga sp.]|nr:M20 family metallopeptidase [Pseudothermotoga sp.]MCX7813727.1 M20 family metallopeptidase [Pseudothermotoga sp.]MDW8140425.1 M20 family metallopeptidase [Pseudothermotoga sp.]
MEKRWLDLFERLVNIDTGFDLDVETKLSRTRFVMDSLKKLGFEVHEEKAAHVAEKGQPPYLTLIGHLDTVFKEGEAIRRPFKVENGVAKGPGVADMKGGVIVLLATVEEALKENLDGLCVVLNVDEELGSKESRNTFENYARKSVCCLSFEPGGINGEIVTSRKGIASLDIVVKGVKGHASRLEEGANAIVEASHKICQIYSMNGIVGSLSVNPTIINGGEKSNITPDLCKVYCDVRFSSKQELKEFEKKLAEITRTSFVERTTCEYNLNERRPAMSFMEEMKQALEEVFQRLGKRYEFEHSSGGADGAFFTALGVPTLDGLGLCGGRFHSEEEFAFIQSFDERVKLSLELLRYFDERR